MAMDEINHIVQRSLNIVLLADLLARFKDCLNGLSATAGAGPSDPKACSSMMTAQLATRRVDDGLRGLSAQGLFKDVRRCKNSQRRVPPFQAINERFTLWRNLFA